MGDRRMMTKQVTDDDNFMLLSSSAQALYLHLNMSADDDGFNNQVTLAMFKAHASVDDLKALLERRYIYQFENGVIVIKHWRMANALRKDRYTPTVFQEELAKLEIKDNGSYTLATKWQPNGNQMATQVNISKDKLSKDKLIEDNIQPKTKRFVKPTIEEIKQYCIERNNNVDADKFFNYYESKGWVVGKSSMKDWKACVRTWESNQKKEQKVYTLDEMNVEEQAANIVFEAIKKGWKK